MTKKVLMYRNYKQHLTYVVCPYRVAVALFHWLKNKPFRGMKNTPNLNDYVLARIVDNGKFTIHNINYGNKNLNISNKIMSTFNFYTVVDFIEMYQTVAS